MRRKPTDLKAQAQKKALNAIKRAHRRILREDIPLSDWEGTFLDSLIDRVQTYGRAFADPDKGRIGDALSIRQTVKLREITTKDKADRPTLARKRKPTDPAP